jgi:MoaA/NifB/PqqE/SkfB family radical SAM enzyme
MFNKETFCILPWSGLQINATGDYKICCFSAGIHGSSSNKDYTSLLDEKGNVMNIMTHSILEAINGDKFKQIRIAHSKNERHPMCGVCWRREDTSSINGNKAQSLRIYRTFNQLQELDNAINLEKASEHFKDDGSLSEMPISLDLRLTNICNMKCVMCNSKYSNQWYDDEIAIYGATPEKENRGANLGWHDSPRWWEQFEIIKNRIRHLYITGGEPFIIKGHDILLDKLIEADLAKEIILEYDTNLSVINDKILNRLKAFKQVILSISCDDVEERYNLVRYGGEFSTLLSNMAKIKERGFEVRHISACIGTHNVYAPIRLYEQFAKMGYNKFVFRALMTPSHMDLKYLPDELKIEVLRVYGESQLPKELQTYIRNYIEVSIGQHTKQKCAKVMKEHIAFFDKLDDLRNTDWKKTNPDVADLLKDYL